MQFKLKDQTQNLLMNVEICYHQFKFQLYPAVTQFSFNKLFQILVFSYSEVFSTVKDRIAVINNPNKHIKK